ncbi:outer membrane protein assembly factor BamE [Sutterella sp.]|uniref:outer membrane protein assembly factor BamE n=1 Tax=Sutterella sp. TaxID=1981025 RepID=UPI0026E0864F|nr:outer membrane protein assembly factor BamE [Sutterella sp.]MDO5532526.1 outer membrane protein assembly factor BamE [Sutterella sp.]
MFKRHLLTLCAALVGVAGLSGCTTVSNAWDSATGWVPYFLKPYRADVPQGNLVTSEMALQLEKGMTDAQVQFLLGVPLIQDQFHEGRWDYVYYLRRGDGEEQIRRLTVWFNDDRRVDHWTSDPMPDEQQADQLILGTIKTFEPRPPKTAIPPAQPAGAADADAEDASGS